MTVSNYRFDAFLSYTTEADYSLARDLESFLESFHELPMPEKTPLRQLKVWRDGSDVSISHAGGPMDLSSMLVAYLAQCNFLVLLWSTKSLESYWMQFELNWFLKNRGPDNVLLGITDSVNPTPETLGLFPREAIEAGLNQKRWYDFRGFRQLPSNREVRDFDEACVQLAAISLDTVSGTPTNLVAQQGATGREGRREELAAARSNWLNVMPVLRLPTAGGRPSYSSNVGATGIPARVF